MTDNQVFWFLLVTVLLVLGAVKEWRRNWRLAVLLLAIPAAGWITILLRDVEMTDTTRAFVTGEIVGGAIGIGGVLVGITVWGMWRQRRSPPMTKDDVEALRDEIARQQNELTHILRTLR